MGSMHSGLESGSVTGGFVDLSRMGRFFARRARGGVGLIVTGGVAPNRAGWVSPFAAKMSTADEMRSHKVVTEMVGEADEECKIAMQILHSGRYGYHPLAVGPSAVKSPIGWFTPKALSSQEVHSTIDDYVNASLLAQEAGYHGVEIMGSEGYLINQFIAKRTNFRDDEWGGSYENRIRLATEIVRKVREATNPDFIIIFRLSMLDLVKGGSSWDEIVQLGKAIEAAGASIINTGIGWHEARIPTIATSVPRKGFTWVTAKMKGEVDIPLCTTNRINMPHVAEQVLQDQEADMVSMARPFLADPDFVNKALANKADEINTCIGCNQACLDHTFKGITASCLVNPESCHEDEFEKAYETVADGKRQRIAVVGAGPAGLAFSTTAARRGHNVTVFEQSSEIGGQFNMAKKIPGKEEFYETIRYFNKQLEKHDVDLQLNSRASVESLAEGGFDSVVLATGISPRTPDIPGIDHPNVLSYIDVLRDEKPVGKSVAIIGAGGIGFDVGEFLSHDKSDGIADNMNIDDYLNHWGVDKTMSQAGGLFDEDDSGARPLTSLRDITLLQRKKGKLGAGLGKTTGWIHRSQLKKMGVKMVGGVSYDKIDEDGNLHITYSVKSKSKSKDGKPSKVSEVLKVDNIVTCAGQLPLRELEEGLQARGMTVFRVGGAEEAGELDAKKAIDMATRLAIRVEDSKAGDVHVMDEGRAAKAIDFMRGILRG